MAQNKRMRMGMARSSSKTRERELLKLAKRLAKNPMIVLPECSPACEKDPFIKARKHLEYVKEGAEDEDLMKRLAKKGDPLARAVAGTILLKHAGKVPMLAVFRTQWGEASFATRGKTPREKLVGVQNMTHPLWRLFAVLDIIKKRKVYVYSGKNKMVCTGRIPDPPKEFVDWDIKHLPYHFNRSGKIHFCKHLKADDVEKNKVEGRAYLSIHWKSADRFLAIDESCAKNENAPSLLSRYMAGPKITEDFDVRVHYRPTCGIDDCSLCHEEWSLSHQEIKKYHKAQLSDLDLIRKGRKTFEDHMTGEGKRVYLAGGICYGSDEAAFIDSLKPDDVERTALETAFTSYDSSLITDGATPSKVLSIIWEDHGLEALNAITGDEELSEELLRSFDPTKTTISSLLHDAAKMIRVHAILSRLPEYGSMPKDWGFADGVARSYRTGGKVEATEYIEKRKDVSMPLAWAFLLALDASVGKEWMFNEIQMEHGGGVKEKARELLQVESTDYHHALSGLMRAVGSSTEVEPLGKNQ